MLEEVDRAIQGLRVGHQVAVYEWARHLGMRVAMRALFGFDADTQQASELAREFERALSFYGKDLALWLLRGPGTPYAKLRSSRKHLAGWCSRRSNVVEARPETERTSSRS